MIKYLTVNKYEVFLWLVHSLVNAKLQHSHRVTVTPRFSSHYDLFDTKAPIIEIVYRALLHDLS